MTPKGHFEINWPLPLISILQINIKNLEAETIYSLCINFSTTKERENSFSSFSILFQIRTPFNYLLMNLIIAESLITMYGLPVDFTATYYFGWKMGENLCKATGFILTTSGKNGILLPELFWPKYCEKKKIKWLRKNFWN